MRPNNDFSASDWFTDDARLVDALRHGDEGAFEMLIQQYQTPMIRLAMMYASDRRLAEEVVQETWIGVLRGLPRFEGRSSLKTWIFSILVNRAKTYARREVRYVQASSFPDTDTDMGEVAVPPERFRPPNDSVAPRHWLVAPGSWGEIPEEHFLSQETRDTIQKAIDALPANQREVITLRDVQQFSSAEVCNILEISESNQRVLLHRARSKVRRALEQYLGQ